MPDEIMKFKLGEALFIKTRIHPIMSNLKSIDKYNLKVGHSNLPQKVKNSNPKLFDLDEHRLQNKLFNEDNKVEL